MKYFTLRGFAVIFLRVNKMEIFMEKIFGPLSLQNFSHWSIASKL